MKQDTLITLAVVGAVGYLVYKLGKGTEQAGLAVADTFGGLATATQGLGGGIATIGTETGDAVGDILSLTNPLRATTDKITSLIKNTPDKAVLPIPAFNTPMGTITGKSGFQMLAEAITKPKSQSVSYAPMTPIYGVNYNPFTNPTSQSFFTASTPAGSVAPLAIQNTVQLAKSDSTIKRAIENKIATPTGNIVTTSTTARYTGGVGKSKVTTIKR